MIETRWTTVSTPSHAARSAVGIGDVAGRELDAPGGEPRRARRVAHERAHVLVARAQRVHDVRPDEARAAGDEDGHVSKFFQYRLGVGPCWPLYFEPISAEPYGVAAGSVICMKEICPIFIPG